MDIDSVMQIDFVMDTGMGIDSVVDTLINFYERQADSFSESSLEI